MIPFVALLAAPTTTVAKDVGLSWAFDGATRQVAPGRYELIGKSFRGEIAGFVAPKGRFDAEALYQKDTERTKEADATKGFRHTRKDDLLAGMLAIRSDQTYSWNGAAVASRCLYGAKGHRAWVVRLWWPAGQTSVPKEVDRFLSSIKAIP